MQPVYDTLKFELRGGAGILTFNAPKKLNAFSKQMRRELWTFWRDIQVERKCRVIIMTGEGSSFCAGSDVNDMCDESSFISKRDVEEVYAFQHEMSEVILYMRRAPQPIIAAVRGYAAGGGFSFAMAADIRLADPTAKFVASYINIGLTAADMGSSYLFPRQVNLGLALEYLYTGDVIDAETATRIGFVNHLVSPEELMPKAQEIADKMLTKSVLGLRMTKEAVNQNMGTPCFESALILENRNQVLGLVSAPIKNPLHNRKKDKGEN
jgi:enoyl-CoA hydratase